MRTENKVKLAFGFCILLLSVIFTNVVYASYQTNEHLSQERTNIQNELSIYTENIINTQSQVSCLKNEINNTKINLTETCHIINLYESDEKYELHYPSYQEVMNFIHTDGTNNKLYNEKTYCCAHYSAEINNKANDLGMMCGLVTIYFSGGEVHAIVAFNTSDRGILFIEPQEDKKVDLEVGEDYWAECVDMSSSRYYYLPDTNNIVDGYKISW